MDRISKLILAVGSFSLAAFGVYKGFSSTKPAKYSLGWIEKLSDNEWEMEREIIREKFCNPKYADTMRIGFQNLLRLFDKVKSDRDWAGLKPRGPAYRREHGYNLYKP